MRRSEKTREEEEEEAEGERRIVRKRKREKHVVKAIEDIARKGIRATDMKS